MLEFSKITIQHYFTIKMRKFLNLMKPTNLIIKLSIHSLIISALFFILSCEALNDALSQFYNWGDKDRFKRGEEQSERELKKWQNQLKISRKKTIELSKEIENFVTEDKLQGILSRKIATRYMKNHRYDLASLYYKGALQNKIPNKSNLDTNSYITFEESLAYFDKALLLGSSNAELFYDAGLAYANASRAQGWEKKRLSIAILLFKRMARIAPNDIRPLYQLAIIYGKTTLSTYKNTDYAIVLLEKILEKKNDDIASRFALAHFFVEKNQYIEAIREYKHIKRILTDMSSRNLLRQKLSSNRQYKKAKENQKKLETCLETKNICNF